MGVAYLSTILVTAVWVKPFEGFVVKLADWKAYRIMMYMIYASLAQESLTTLTITICINLLTSSNIQTLHERRALSLQNFGAYDIFLQIKVDSWVFNRETIGRWLIVLVVLFLHKLDYIDLFGLD